jgi:hypothetical protein
MKTAVMTGGTAGFGAVAAKTLPLALARLSNVRSFVQSLKKKLNGTKIDILIMNAGAQFGNAPASHGRLMDEPRSNRSHSAHGHASGPMPSRHLNPGFVARTHS